MNKNEVVSIRQAVARCREEGLPVSEYSLRRWVKAGLIPVRWAGSKALIFFPALEDYLRCGSENGGRG